MHEDIVVSNGVWKFVGNPEVACKCLHSHKCTQFPEKVINVTPFVQLKDSATKLCVRVWKFHPNKPKFQIGDKVVQYIPAMNPYHNPMNIVGIISSISMSYLTEQWSYVIHAETGYAVTNAGKVLSEWKYENHNTIAYESELEKVS